MRVCVPAIVHGCVFVCVSVHGRVYIDREEEGEGGTLLFARLFPNMAPLLRTQEKNSVVLSK